MAKKGILIRNGSQEVHKLDDEGGFKLGMRGEGVAAGTVQLRAQVISITEDEENGQSQSVASLHGSIQSVADKIDGEKGNGTTTGTDTVARNDIRTKLAALQAKLDGSGSVAWAAGEANLNDASDFVDADKKLDTQIGNVQNRMAQIMGDTHETSIKRRIAEVVFGTDDGGLGARLPATAFDTIKGIQDSLLVNAASIPASDLSSSVATAVQDYIDGQMVLFRQNTEAANQTLSDMSSSIATEVSRYNTKHNGLTGEFETTMTNIGLAADGAFNPDNTGNSYLINNTDEPTMKARDMKLDSAIKARDNRMNDLFGSAGTMSLSSLVVASDADLKQLSFGADSGRFTLPSMAGADAIVAGLADHGTGDTSPHNGKFVFITTAGAAPFEQPNKLYMCEDGVWSASLFRKEES